MNLSLFTSFVLTSFLISAYPLAYADGVQSVETRTGFQEHTYERISGPTDACVSDVMDLKYEQTGENVVLHLGELFIFADIARNGYTDDTEPGCKLTVTNSLKKNEIVQERSNTCEDALLGFSETQTLKQTRDRLVYSLKKKTGSPKNSTVEFTCVFQVEKNP
jgi:hypothetical protein